MRYLLFSYLPVPKAAERRRGLTISGLYHWAQVFSGEIGAPPLDSLSDYDIVHLNFTGGSLGHVHRIAEACRRSLHTKFILNVDYSVDLWSNNIPFPTLFLKEIDQVDLIFHVEPRGAALLETALKRHVPVIPHPVDVSSLASVAFQIERQPILSVISHRYDNDYMEAWLLAETIRQETGVATALFLCNANAQQDFVDRVLPMFSGGCVWSDYDDFIYRIAESSVVYDTASLSTFGRVVGECAAMGVPVVCNDSCFAGRELFPETTFPAHRADLKLQALRDLFTVPGFYRSVSAQATQRVSQLCGYEVSRRRLLTKLGLLAQPTGEDAPVTTVNGSLGLNLGAPESTDGFHKIPSVLSNSDGKGAL